MKSPYTWLAESIASRPFAVAAVIFCIFVLALFGLTLVTMETGDDTYIDPETPRGALLAHYGQTYGSDAIMLIFETDDVRNPEVLAYIDRVSQDLGNEQYVIGVSGITDLLKQGNGGTLPGSIGEINAIMSQAPPGMIERYLPSNMMTISVIALETGVSSRVQEQVLGNVRTIISLSDPPPGVSVTVSGSPAFSQEMGEEMGSSMGILIMAAMVLMVFAVMLLFSHVRYSLLPVFVVAAGLILTFGIMGLLGIAISMVVIAAFPVLIGIGIDYAIQLHSRLDEEVRQAPLNEAIKTVVTKSGPSILIAMLATAMGFIAMMFGPVPMVGDFGLVCTLGVLSCYTAALVIVPVFAVLTQYRPKNTTKEAGKGDPGTSQNTSGNSGPVPPVPVSSYIERYDQFLGKLAYSIAKNPVPLLIIICLIAAVGFQLDQEVPISADEKTFVPSEMPALLNMNKVTRTMGSTSSIPVIVSGDTVLSGEALQWIHDFGAYVIDRNEQVTGVTSIATLLVQYNDGTLPGTDAEVLAVMDHIPPETRDRYLHGTMETVMEFSTVDMEISAARSLADTFRADVAWNDPPPGLNARVTGSLEMFGALMDDISNSKTQMSVIGFAFILGFLLIVYRKVRAVSPLIPIVIIVGWNGAIMFILGLDYTPMTAVLGSMTIGVASEYTILIMERCDEELARGMDIYQAIQTSVQKIGTAVTVSGLTTVFGFSALILSEFNMISNFGIVTVITVGFSLIGAIVIMPAVLSLMYRFDRNGAGMKMAAVDGEY
ncbi:MAG: hydrophobe/amphiphile efflux-3 (HAE3) family transporter [Methanoregulaceae archaeon]|jgi:hypothetical protein